MGDAGGGFDAEVRQYLVGIAYIVVGLAVIRLVVGRVVGVGVAPVTVWGILAGAYAAVVMTELYPFLPGRGPAPWVGLWLRVDPDAGRDALWRGNWVQIAGGAVAGGAYPWVAAHVLALSGPAFAGGPTAVGWAVAWAGVLYVFGGVSLVAAGVGGGRRPVVALASAGTYLAYGVVFGALMGVWRPVFGPLFVG